MLDKIHGDIVSLWYMPQDPCEEMVFLDRGVVRHISGSSFLPEIWTLSPVSNPGQEIYFLETDAIVEVSRNRVLLTKAPFVPISSFDDIGMIKMKISS